MFVLGCVRSIMPLPSESVVIFCAYFTDAAWHSLLEAYYSVDKCKVLNKRARPYNLDLFKPTPSKTDTEGVRALGCLNANLLLHRLLINRENDDNNEGFPNATQFNDSNTYVDCSVLIIMACRDVVLSDQVAYSCVQQTLQEFLDSVVQRLAPKPVTAHATERSMPPTL